MDTIYQQIWDADQLENGVPAVRPDQPKNADVGFVVVDERADAVTTGHRVLKEVVIPDSKLQTYNLCEKLLDNYALLRAANEHVQPEETQEELDFIDAIIDTKPIQKAREILESRLSLSISRDNLTAMIHETWFQMGRSGTQEDASGFEHVFVGEQSSKATKIGGYHYWHKYFLDDGGAGGNDSIRYHGTQYHKAQEPDKGILIPEVVTLSVVWHAPHGDTSGSSGSGPKELSKPIGGFFVGCSPEGLIALGLVRCRTKSGKITKINGAEYQLDLHRLDDKPNSIRTFFPRFRKADFTVIQPNPDPGTTPTPPPPTANAGFKVVAAMVNPVNPEGGREFLQIINTSNSDANLRDWQIVTPNGTRFDLAENSLTPGEVLQVLLPATVGVLRNKGGDILFNNPAGETVQVCTYSKQDASKEGTVVLF